MLRFDKSITFLPIFKSTLIISFNIKICGLGVLLFSEFKIILKSQQRFKNDHHKVYTEEIKKIALSSNDDKRLQTSDRIKTYPLGTNAFKVCESEMLEVKLQNKNDQI